MYADGEVSYKYRHWGCVTPFLLRSIKSSGGARNLGGFARLKVEDQEKVIVAVANGKVDPADVPPSARSLDMSSLDITPILNTATTSQAVDQSAPSNKKRKRDELSQATATQSSTLSRSQDIVELSDSSDEDGGAPTRPGAKKRKVAEA
ncbi:hypothetical protein FRC17_003563, partial [Serendipita sp. 399]